MITLKWQSPHGATWKRISFFFVCLFACFFSFSDGRFAVVNPFGALLYIFVLLIKSCIDCSAKFLFFCQRDATNINKKIGVLFVPSPPCQGKKSPPFGSSGDVMSWSTCREDGGQRSRGAGWGGGGPCCKLSLQKNLGVGRWPPPPWSHVSTGLGTILFGVSGNWEDKEVTSLPEEFPREPDSEKDTWREENKVSRGKNTYALGWCAETINPSVRQIDR